MKVFLITWGGLCFLVIVGLIIVYATDQLPGASTPQAEYAQGEILTLAEEECSPCEENLKRLTEAMEAGDDLLVKERARDELQVSADEHQASINAEKAYAEYLAAADELQASINAANVPHEKQTPKKAYVEYLRAFVTYKRNTNAENLAHLKQTAKEFQKILGSWGDVNLTEGVSPVRFDTAQQWIDEYGTEEGLRRLREVAPEAAQQFERERLRSESPRPSEPSRDAPESGQ